MPSIAATIPQYPRSFDLQEVTDLTERQLQSAHASTFLVMEAVRSLPATESVKALDTVRTLLAAAKLAVDQMVTNKATSTPAFVLSAPGLTAYKHAVNSSFTATALGYIADVKEGLDTTIEELESVYKLV